MIKLKNKNNTTINQSTKKKTFSQNEWEWICYMQLNNWRFPTFRHLVNSGVVNGLTLDHQGIYYYRMKINKNKQTNQVRKKIYCTYPKIEHDVNLILDRLNPDRKSSKFNRSQRHILESLEFIKDKYKNIYPNFKCSKGWLCDVINRRKNGYDIGIRNNGKIY